MANSPSSVAVADLKGVLTGKSDAFLRVVKSPNVALAFGFLIVGQGLSVVAQYFQAQKVAEFGSSLGLELGDLGLGWGALSARGVFGLVTAVLLVAAYHWTSMHWFGGKNVSLPGFFTLYGYTSVLMWLQPVPLLNLVAVVWMVVLFFKEMKAVLGFGFWKAFGTVLLTGVLVMIVVGLVVNLTGLDSLLGLQESFSFGSKLSY